ncbi:bifunctional (p)ppGpp synthetase/guanosine-3',5'-bis(diphosphate) 3'-pyrophosphohydrolase [Ensifer sp. ENS10]|uniref:HD domain-containing protein n=1 Tax=Ensifer sp. ENS10 TaxID=2769286 RepID=UPI00177FCB7A|nr:HD domain-containing protein [Ensifer sp. ENS10]MBD9511579.1 bifunctional (p)ppGpp synthetase/guanosine-3',5'-bis(diphosphate) 3'-pyrophosphohydrolase [Ensifer sp. ENS10]
MGYSQAGANKVQMARAFATAAHGAIAQVRKYTGEPYIVHPEAVASIVETVPTHTWQMLCCAWLHDVVEDTEVDSTTISDIFGGEIAMGVMHLTNVPKEMGNRAKRLELNLLKLSNAPDWVKTVKVADLYDNTKTIVKYDPNFARLYLKEKAQALEVLRGADRVLWQLTYEQLGNAALSLEKGYA